MHLVGELAPEMISAFLNALDVFVFPSRVETFGLAVVEAAPERVPVVCNDIEVLREVLQIDEEPCVQFVDVGDPSAFQSTIREALHDNASLSSSAARLRDKYSLRRMVDGYSQALRSAGLTFPDQCAIFYSYRWHMFSK